MHIKKENNNYKESEVNNIYKEINYYLEESILDEEEKRIKINNYKSNNRKIIINE